MRLLDSLSEVSFSSFGDLALRVREAVAQRPGVSALTLIVGPQTSDADAAHLARLAPIDVPVSIIRIGAEACEPAVTSAVVCSWIARRWTTCRALSSPEAWHEQERRH